MRVTGVLAEVEKDRTFYGHSGGGMTVSGGEPLAQPDFCMALLAAATNAGIDTCLETSALLPADWARLAEITRLFLVDVKETAPERHLEFTGVSNEPLLVALRTLERLGAPVVLRCPIVPGLNLRDEHLRGIAALADSLKNCGAVQILPYHPMGGAKTARIGGAPAMMDDAMPREDYARVVERLRSMCGKRVC
jgi:pyruvate formate lyase activating enzyme